MKAIRNKGCLSNFSHALLASKFPPRLSPFPSAVLVKLCPLKGGGFNAVIVIVLSVFELRMRLLLTCKYFRLNWAK